MLRKIKVFLEMIKFEHTIFALPFAYMGALLGASVVNGQLPTGWQLFWVTIAMIGSRSAAMGLNRLIDRAIDAKNERTSMRAIPAGLLQAKEVILFIVISFVLLFIAAFQLSDLAIKLLPVAVFFLVIYSYTKRFTWLCHVVLGLTIGLAPLGGWVAVTNGITWTAIVFYIAVSLWIAGFDLIYACQDIEFDRAEGLYSIPSRFGIAVSLHTAKVFHFVTFMSFIGLGVLANLGTFYWIGLGIAGAVLIYEHLLVNPTDLSKLNVAFFTMNGILSVVVFVFTLIDLVV
jgi:4-hydroxybenzoate polyprenyltransferase